MKRLPTRREVLALPLLLCMAGAARADAVDDLKRFVREVQTGRADFTQVVSSPDGARQKTSSGRFEFARPDRFRFQYLKPFEQLIVSDGRKVWIHDPDLNQVSSRPLDQALGATPAALLAGGPIERNFDVAAQPDRNGLSWVQATPKVADGPFKSLQVGFRAGELAEVEIVDSFGQRSVLRFSGLQSNPALGADHFRFTMPAGADLIEQ